ncbi:hypothetical protein [Nonomuraea lactucae]|uniref:hypothetical protein n=1 Tax=Nonomuraea lactucae TaxID=2249762 RepID=UPI0013B3820A|nr:hypothetical protein [Nonomuraea lactucae]
MSPHEIRARLLDLRDYLTTQLDNEHRNAQSVLERVDDDLDQIIVTITAADPPWKEG